MDIQQLLRRTEKFVLDNSPTILTVLGATGTLTTAFLTAKATFKAASILSEEPPELATKEKAKLVWRVYIPPAVSATITVTAIIAAHRISAGRAAALAAALSLSDKAFEEYKSKVLEKMGDKKERAVREEIAQDRLDRDPVSKREVIIAGNGDVLCYDSYTGRYFTSSMEALRRAENKINHRLIHEHYASLSDFYEEVGLPTTVISEELGWNLDHMLELDISAGMSDDNRPCLVLGFGVSPARNYFRCL
jgi:hypothetical protein